MKKSGAGSLDQLPLILFLSYFSGSLAGVPAFLGYLAGVFFTFLMKMIL